LTKKWDADEDANDAKSWKTKEDCMRTSTFKKKNINLKKLKLIQRIKLWIML
jgi:hypothetical protein